jgi:hypothetical protein
MPNYLEDVEKAGWSKKGKYWVNPNRPGVEYWSQIECWEKEDFPGKRPYSVTPPEKKPPLTPAPLPAPSPLEAAIFEAAPLEPLPGIAAAMRVTAAPLPKVEIAAPVDAEPPLPKKRGRPKISW